MKLYTIFLVNNFYQRVFKPFGLSFGQRVNIMFSSATIITQNEHPDVICFDGFRKSATD